MKLSDIAISKLLDLITVQKKYQPGDKLPNEAGLAQELHVSRNTPSEPLSAIWLVRVCWRSKSAAEPMCPNSRP